MHARHDAVPIEKVKPIPPEGRARDEAAQRLGEAFAKLDTLSLPPMSPEDVQAEIDAARAARHGRDADRR